MFEVKFKPTMARLKKQRLHKHLLNVRTSSSILRVDLTPIKISGSSTSQVPDIIKELTQSWKHLNCYKRLFNLENLGT